VNKKEVIKVHKRVLLLITLLLIFILSSPTIIADDFIGHLEESVVNVYTRDGKYIFATAMGVSVGDRYINEENIEYVVEMVNGNRAIAVEKGKVNLLEGVVAKKGENIKLTPLAANGNKLIGLYFTHNGESYLPGPVNIKGQGEIHEVGEVLKAALEERGIQVVKMDNIHLPHDGAAYERSRDTAIDIAQKRPDAIFDVHRDAIPRKEEYLKNINGQLVSRVRLVVGRQNPNRSVNDKFARQLKAITDQKYPGLIKGIFYGQGNYNQTIAPHSLLLEFGTHVTTKEQAQASAKMIAASIDSLLYGEGRVDEEGVKGENPSAFRTIAWIVGILVVGILAYLFINEGSIEGVLKRIKNFFGREIIDRGDS